AVGPRARRAAEVVKIVALAFSFVFLLAVVWWGIPEIRDSLRYESRTESLAFPMWPFLLALLVGFALMAVSVFFEVYRGMQKLRGRDVLEEPSETGEAPH
ncbi:MAG TPA: TRAP transporter small permease subunit, partial [Burkholderiales bacterium]|nr:TRAP transporter small permease subunit [Burkholderiales bacterium]